MPQSCHNDGRGETLAARTSSNDWGCDWLKTLITGGGMDIHWYGQAGVEHQERVEEARKIRRLQLMISMVMSVISQDPDLTVEEASEMVANARRAALTMFPDKELAFDILYKPRLQRLMNERFRMQ